MSWWNWWRKPISPVTGSDIENAINNIRKSYGLVRLTDSPSLDAQALAHCQVMAQKQALSHDGFPARIAAVFPNTAAGENVAENPYHDADAMARQWMADAGHRNNMLGNWDYVSVAIVTDNLGQNWITADFDYSRN